MSIFNQEEPRPKTNIEFNAASCGFNGKALEASLGTPLPGLKGVNGSVKSGCEVTSTGAEMSLGAGVSITPYNGNLSISPSLLP